MCWKHIWHLMSSGGRLIHASEAQFLITGFLPQLGVDTKTTYVIIVSLRSFVILLIWKFIAWLWFCSYAGCAPTKCVGILWSGGCSRHVSQRSHCTFNASWSCTVHRCMTCAMGDANNYTWIDQWKDRSMLAMRCLYNMQQKRVLCTHAHAYEHVSGPWALSCKDVVERYLTLFPLWSQAAGGSPALGKWLFHTAEWDFNICAGFLRFLHDLCYSLMFVSGLIRMTSNGWKSVIEWIDEGLIEYNII